MKVIHILIAIIPLLFACKDKGVVYIDPVPEHDSLTLYSSLLQEDRVINVWVPPAYHTSSDSFPVLYMPDGGVREDFPHIANTLAKLIDEGKIPEFILVGIENTERGRDLTGFSVAEYDKQFCPVTDGAKDFRAFITETLIPEIHRGYRTSDQQAIIGESLAGLFVMETFFIQPEAFDIYIAMDPSLWWNDHYLARQADSLLPELPAETKKLWFAGSNTEDISQFTRNVAASLERRAPSQLIWRYSDEPNEKHNTIFRATKEKALIWALND